MPDQIQTYIQSSFKHGRCVFSFLKLLQVFGTQILKKNPEARNKTEHLLVFWGFFLCLFMLNF